MRILIIAYHFPPLNSIASHRPYSWAKAWSALGHEVHVLTPAKHAFDGTLDLDYDVSGIPIHTAPFLGKASAPAAVSDRSAYAAKARDWDRFKIATRRLRLGLGMFTEIASLGYFSLVRTGLAVLKSAKFDLIISTAPPEVIHFAGHALAARTGIPWVADYRDLWFPEMRLHHFRWVAALTGLASKKLLKSARLVSTVSQGLSSRLKEFLGRDVHVCYNGFFADMRHDPGPRPWRDDRIHVVYTGRLFPGKRDPAVLLRALGSALRAAPTLASRLAIDIYGHDEPWLRRLIEQHGAAECVHMHGFVSYEKSLAAQRHADYLLFVDWMDEKAEGVLTGKLFEYLDSGRPILCIGANPDSEAARLIRSGQAGVVLTDVGAIEALLNSLPDRAPAARTPRARVEQYSREHQAKSLLDAIRPAISR